MSLMELFNRGTLYAGIILASERPGADNAYWGMMIRALCNFGVYPLEVERNRATYEWSLLCHASPESRHFDRWERGMVIPRYSVEVRNETRRHIRMNERMSVSADTSDPLMPMDTFDTHEIRVIRLIPFNERSTAYMRGFHYDENPFEPENRNSARPYLTTREMREQEQAYVAYRTSQMNAVMQGIDNAQIGIPAALMNGMPSPGPGTAAAQRFSERMGLGRPAISGLTKVQKHRLLIGEDEDGSDNQD